LTVLVLGYGPWRHYKTTPSERFIHELDERALPGIVTGWLPTSREQALREVPDLIATHRPEAWIGVGTHFGALAAMIIDIVALNIASWPVGIPDEDGRSIIREPIVADGPQAHLTTFPVDEILQAWEQAGIPRYMSRDGTSYLCNMAYYLAAQTVQELALDCRVGFLHIPWYPDQVFDPSRQRSMAGDLLTQGFDHVLAALRAASANDRDASSGAAAAAGARANSRPPQRPDKPASSFA
jgi:pyroglutamyl-peptidase